MPEIDLSENRQPFGETAREWQRKLNKPFRGNAFGHWTGEIHMQFADQGAGGNRSDGHEAGQHAVGKGPAAGGEPVRDGLDAAGKNAGLAYAIDDPRRQRHQETIGQSHEGRGDRPNGGE